MRWLIDASAARHSGAMTHHLGILPALDEVVNGDEVRVLVSEELAAALGERTSSLELEVVPHRPGLGRWTALNSRVKAHVRAFRPDGVMFGQYAPWSTATPFVLRMTDGHLVDHEQRRRLMRFYSPLQRVVWRVKVAAFRRSVRNAGAVLCATEAVRDDLLAAHPELDPARVLAAPYGLSPLASAPPGPRAPGGRRLLTMHLSPRKNVEAILEALARPGMEAFELTVLGDLDRPDTRYTRFLARRARDLGVFDRVHSAGYIRDQERLREEVLRHDALLCPSRIESWSHTVIEGMALGVPVVASDIPCHREVSGGAAWLVGGGDPDLLARAIRDAVSREPKAERRREQAREVARSYDWRTYAEAMLDALRTAAGASGGGR